MPHTRNRIKIGRSFGDASESYDVCARLQRFTGKHMLPWLPEKKDLIVLDLGCGTGFFSELLATRYDQVLGADISFKMLDYAKKNRTGNINWTQADAFKLPYQTASIDVVYSNLMIQWCEPIDKALAEIMRVIKPGGIFVVSTLIDGTLHELKSSWAQVDDDKHVIDFHSEKELNAIFNSGSAKKINHFRKDIVLEYENVLHLATELKGLGANQVPKKLSKGLAGKDKWKKMSKNYQDFQEPSGIYPATYSVYSAVMIKLTS
ncbi:malonyl-ACP O-methyltransferase BioC [Thalassotalea profundi]|uniref:Malonyl-[acyl-carrier protein] O-methyltransferase n=1 Tax=Thalassotalea profundi TaxID=2036687 RepID=A0ABQ3II90_9GAMM|nr:malonyl-ACP O-methyltransferase BioC [Thalassotalea profundi]GHE82742.1 biotin synthesis protein BioC [Thalassotalea profundi]